MFNNVANSIVYVFLVADEMENYQEPSSYTDAISTSDSDKWMTTMKEEMKSLENNKNYKLVKLPNEKSQLGANM